MASITTERGRYPDAKRYAEPIDYKSRRRRLYNERGSTQEAISEALMEASEGRGDKLAALQAIRALVKAEIPKPK